MSQSTPFVCHVAPGIVYVCDEGRLYVKPQEVVWEAADGEKPDAFAVFSHVARILSQSFSTVPVNGIVMVPRNTALPVVDGRIVHAMDVIYRHQKARILKKDPA